MALSDTPRSDRNLGSTADTSLAHTSRLNAIDWIALVLMIVGGLNWGLVGILDFDLVAALFGPMTGVSRVVYALVGLAAVWGLVMLAKLGKRS
jgi:uncharacterized membrane protein YuzA (DUF378 family)